MNALVDTAQKQRPRLCFAPAEFHQTGDFSPAKPQRKGKTPWLFLAGFLLLAGYALFCHGCHGDEDNELFASGSATPPTVVAVVGGNRSGEDLTSPHQELAAGPLCTRF